MENRVLMIACVPSMIGQFNMNNIHILQELGYEVDVACDFTDRSIWTDERVDKFKRQLEDMGIFYYQIDFSRTPLSLKRHRKSYFQVKRLCIERKYRFVHCHTPIASAITRLVCKTINMKVIYTAHGFHFYKGAPLKNWILFYPIEKWLSRYTEVLITINKEDYERAKKKLKAKHTEHVPGIGVDIEKIRKIKSIRKELIHELEIEDKSAILMLSVGELSHRKNHGLIIQCMPKLPEFYHYLIVGIGSKEQDLKELSYKLGVTNRVHLLGYRNNVIELMKSCDLFIFPSLQEGLPVALMEAIVSRIPCVASDIRGNRDVVECSQNGILFDFNETHILDQVISKTVMNKKKSIGDNNVRQFDIRNINSVMKNLYSKVNVFK